MKHYRERLRLQIRIHTVLAITLTLFALWAFAGEPG